MCEVDFSLWRSNLFPSLSRWNVSHLSAAAAAGGRASSPELAVCSAPCVYAAPRSETEQLGRRKELEREKVGRLEPGWSGPALAGRLEKLCCWTDLDPRRRAIQELLLLLLNNESQNPPFTVNLNLVLSPMITILCVKDLSHKGINNGGKKFYCHVLPLSM